MTVRQQWVAVASVVAMAGAALWGGVAVFGDQFSQVTVGSHAPDFRAVTLDSAPQTRTMADYRGQVTLLNLWATWCAPCEREMPMLQQLYERYRARGFRLVAVSVDSPGMEPAIREFVERHRLTFDVLHDPESGIARAYASSGFPESFLIGKDGVIRRWTAGPLREGDVVTWGRVVEGLLGEQ